MAYLQFLLKELRPACPQFRGNFILIKLAKELDAATNAGREMGLTDDEKAFYDALAANESAVEAMGDDKLKLIAAELITQVRESVTIDWTLRDSASVIEALSDAVLEHGTPQHVRCDSGSEFIAARVQRWLRQAKIRSRFIEPGRPWQNGHNESFNGKTRDECLEREVFANLLEARSMTAGWREEHNTFRPHRWLGQLTPAQSQLSGRCPGLRTIRFCAVTSTQLKPKSTRPTSHFEWTKIAQPATSLFSLRSLGRTNRYEGKKLNDVA